MSSKKEKKAGEERQSGSSSPEKKKKQEQDDDGRVIVNMNLENFSWYRKDLDDPRKKPKNDPDTPTAKEMRALILAAYRAYLPYFLILLGVLLAMAVLGYLMLH